MHGEDLSHVALQARPAAPSTDRTEATRIDKPRSFFSEFLRDVLAAEAGGRLESKCRGGVGISLGGSWSAEMRGRDPVRDGCFRFLPVVGSIGVQDASHNRAFVVLRAIGIVFAFPLSRCERIPCEGMPVAAQRRSSRRPCEAVA